MPFSIKKFAQLHRNQPIPGSPQQQKEQPQQQQQQQQQSSSNQTSKSKNGHTLSNKPSIDNENSTVATSIKTGQSNKKGSKKSKTSSKQLATANDNLGICSPTPGIRNIETNNIQSQQLLASSPAASLAGQHQTPVPAPLPRTVPPSFIICNQASMINVPLYPQTAGSISPIYNPTHHPSLGSIPNSRSFDTASGTNATDLYRLTNQSSKNSFVQLNNNTIF